MSRLAPLSQCLHALRGTFERAIGQAQALDRPVLVAASFEIDPLDPLQVFGAWDDRQTPCLYWEQPELAFFAWGCALELQGHGEQRFARIEENWQLLCADAVVEGPLAPRLCGGFRFDPRGPREEHWQAFADASLMLAGITVLREGKRYRVLCQHLAKPGEDALALAAYHCSALLRLRQPARRRPSGPTAGAQGDASAQERRQWEAKVSDAVSSVRQGRFGKVVLARTQARPLGDIEPWQVIEHLRLQHADAQLFACRRGNACFLGASPERLVRIRAGEVLTHALAGTIARGGDAQEDARLGQALLDSAKDRHEHQLVVEAIRTALEPFSEVLESPAPEHADPRPPRRRRRHPAAAAGAASDPRGGRLPTQRGAGLHPPARRDGPWLVRRAAGLARRRRQRRFPGGAALGPAHAGPGLPVRRLRSGRRFGTGPRVSRNLP